ncbi:MAG: prepilin peptidase [Massilia sp.]
MSVNLCLDLGLLVLVLLAAASDLATRRIPNRLLLAGLAGALALRLLGPAPGAALLAALAGAGTGLLVFLPLYLLRGMAAGDVKFLATVGAFSAPPETLHIALAAVLAGGVLALVVVVARGRLWRLLVNLRAMLAALVLRASGVPATLAPPTPSVGSLPYGVAIAAGVIYMLAQRHLGFPSLL